MIYTREELHQMSMFRRITILKDLAEQHECCNEDCDESTPFAKCDGCRAGSALNEIGEIIRDVLTK